MYPYSPPGWAAGLSRGLAGGCHTTVGMRASWFPSLAPLRRRMVFCFFQEWGSWPQNAGPDGLPMRWPLNEVFHLE